MRVLHLIVGLGKGGAETMLCNLIPELSSRGWQSEVVTMIDSAGLRDEVLQGGVRVSCLRMVRGHISARVIPALRRLLVCSRPDLIQTWMYHANLLGSVAAYGLGIPVAWSIHHANLDARYNRRLTIATARAGAYLSRWLPQRVICCSEASVRSHAAIGYAREQLCCIPNGFDTDRFAPNPQSRECCRASLGIDATARVVGLVARYDPLKDHATFVDAAGILSRTRPDLTFLLCGAGVTRDNHALVRMIEAAGIGGKTILAGVRDDMPDVTNALDVCCLSSTGESFPTVIGEAMSTGVPCVATDVGDCRSMIADTGVVVPPQSPACLAAAIAQIIDLPAHERRRLGSAARHRIISHFSLGRAGEHYARVYDEIAGSETMEHLGYAHGSED